jgi:signal transduction histidine kinase/CheY-like chemotaxis protein
VGLAEPKDDGFVVAATVGDGSPVGERVPPPRASLLGRAVAEGGLVSDLISDERGTRLVLALPTATGSAVVYRESVIDPSRVAPSTPDSPYRELRVALYASPTPDPSRLVLTTEQHVPWPGRVVHKPFDLGADRWLLALSPRGPLVGSFSRNAPWLLLAGGLVTAVLAAVMADTLARRRAYALGLVARRTAELEHAMGELRHAQHEAHAANEAKSEFLSRMSHELRTPLNAILGFGQLLQLDDEQLSGEQHESIDHILKAGRHLLDLINEVLDISRIEAGHLALSPEPLHVGALIRDSVELIRPLADQQGIRLLTQRGQPADCHVFADHQRTKQILLNLLSNAVKYNRSRGTVTVSWAVHGDTRVRINVTDTGHGIPAERRGLLFAPFERLGAEETDVEGTGIGLALSLRLAEAMDGTIDVSSALGQGSTFTVELPRAEDPVERYDRLKSDTATDAAPQPVSHRQQVLHIEDNLSNLKLIERVLERRPDIDLIPAMQGGLGLDLAREHHPALILLDLHLPDIAGEHVLQRLHDDPTTTSIPVIIVSADATPRQRQRLLAAGAAGYLTKPIDVPELLRTLDHTLQTPVPGPDIQQAAVS